MAKLQRMFISDVFCPYLDGGDMPEWEEMAGWPPDLRDTLNRNKLIEYVVDRGLYHGERVKAKFEGEEAAIEGEIEITRSCMRRETPILITLNYKGGNGRYAKRDVPVGTEIEFLYGHDCLGRDEQKSERLRELNQS